MTARRSRRQRKAEQTNTDPNKEETKIARGSIGWRRLFGLLGPHKLRLAFALLAIGITSGTSLIFPMVIVQMLETAIRPGGDLTGLNNLTLGLLLLFLVQAAFTVVESFNLAYIGEKVLLRLRTQLYSHLQTLSLSFFESRRVGELISRIASDVATVRSVLVNELTSMLGTVISLIGSVVIVFLTNPALTLFILLLVPVILVVGFGFGMPLQRISGKVQDELAAATATADEGLQGVRIVKSFAREGYESQRYEQAMGKTFKATMKVAIYRAGFGGTMAFLGFGSLALFLWFSGREVIEGRLTLPMISGFLIYGISIAANLGSLAGFYTNFREALGAISRVFGLLDTKPIITDSPDAKPLTVVGGQVRFADLSFSYETRPNVLSNINLEVAAGEIIAVVGPSGAGKSTLFNLIPRFYDPEQGAIYIDGHDLRTVTQHSLREQIGIVPQETILFSGPIRENILYGKLDASEAEVIAAAKAANAHDFIMSLPDKYDTTVGERGVKLSGGQRQRVAIARAILKDPRILLLDEATSALDSESEELVQEALERLMQNRTTLIIAHRLSTIKIANRIAVLDQGRLAELGNHAELMALNGVYAKLYTMQFGESVAEVGA
jgi:ATP-binding cassette, subfamily B, bacterial MsbA